MTRMVSGASLFTTIPRNDLKDRIDKDEANRQTNKQTYKQTDNQTNRQPNKQTTKQTENQTNWKTKRQMLNARPLIEQQKKPWTKTLWKEKKLSVKMSKKYWESLDKKIKVIFILRTLELEHKIVTSVWPIC